MKWHVNDCFENEETRKFSEEDGSGLDCLSGVVGWPLQLIFHGMVALWGMIWAVKRDVGKSMVFSQYFKAA